jgi:hypothetical protein
MTARAKYQKPCRSNYGVNPTRAVESACVVSPCQTVADPCNGWQCWARVTTLRGQPISAGSMQCGSRRQGPHIKGGEPRYCCRQHQKIEDVAKAWADSMDAQEGKE